jgi:hypothetical protein
MTPDRAAFERDVAAAPFCEGAARNRWSLVEVEWPHAIFGIAARDNELYHLRLNLEGYAAIPPTGGLWDIKLNSVPEPAQWPLGDATFMSVFRRDWHNGTALYFPLDRVSLHGHHDWPTQYPHLIWDPTIGLTQHLGEVHRLLNSRSYHGLPS